MEIALANWVQYSIFGIFFCIGCGNLINLIRKKSWVESKCKILDSKLDVHEHHEMPDIGVDLDGYAYKTEEYKNEAYTPSILYQYEVDGKEYRNNRVRSAPILPLSPKDILMFTYGSTQPVWYNPSNPAQSYITPSSVIPSLLTMGLGVSSLFFFELKEYFDLLIALIANSIPEK